MYLPNTVYETTLIIAIIIIPISMLFFSNVPTPYGKFYKKDIWGPDLDEKNAWSIMESTGLFMFLIFYFLLGKQRFNYVPLVFLSMWIFHYINRSIIYPHAIMKQKYKKFPLILVILGFLYLSMFACYFPLRIFFYMGMFTCFFVFFIFSTNLIIIVIIVIFWI
jgi:hypothetical protein